MCFPEYPFVTGAERTSMRNEHIETFVCERQRLRTSLNKFYAFSRGDTSVSSVTITSSYIKRRDVDPTSSRRISKIALRRPNVKCPFADKIIPVRPQPAQIPIGGLFFAIRLLIIYAM